MRFGLIGYGLFGAHHANAIANCVDAELAAIAVRSEASQQSARAAHPTAEVLGDYRRLIERDDIDVVSIVAPNKLHYEIGKAVLESRKHLLLEKPMALRMEHCDELVALAEANQLVLAV
ncbi:MAG: Gfo/Idh/MocA family oxidoreductase, partial [Candidatus Paceibacterota bacterium]